MKKIKELNNIIFTANGLGGLKMSEAELKYGDTGPKDFDETSWEAHRKYFDIQFVVKGTEVIKVSQKSTMRPYTDYNSEGDYQLLTPQKMFINLD